MRRHLSRLLLPCSLVSLGLLACGGSSSSASSSGNDSGGPAPTLDQADVARLGAATVSPADEASAVSANNAFAADLYTRLGAQSADQNQNFLTSPLSASLALTMTYAGAQGETATQMATALHLGSGAATIFSGQNALSQALAQRGMQALTADQGKAGPGGTAPSPDDYALQVVNSVWGEQTYPWATPFLDILAQDYGTGVYLEDFVNGYDAARLAINGWVTDQTSGKITNLLSPGSLDSTTRMVLVNAIHLKLPWANPFEVAGSQPSSFTRADGSVVMPTFMNGTLTVPYTDDGQAQVVALPLAGQDLYVVVALPHGDLASYEATLSAGSAALSVPSNEALVALSLPKVSFTSPSFSLTDTLKSMGMTDAFDPNAADLGGLTADARKLHIADVLQETEIGMQETGVEAAAATAVIVAGMDAVAGPPPMPTPVVVDRPYVVSIVDAPTGAVLFLGHIVDPTQGSGG